MVSLGVFCKYPEPFPIVIGRRNAIRHLEVVQGGLASLGLLGQPALHHPPEDASGAEKQQGLDQRGS